MVPKELKGPVASLAWRISGVMGAFAAVAFVMGQALVGTGLLLLALANLAFFRNPRRVVPPGEHRVVAPADGRIVEVTKLEDPDGFVGAAWRVAIFLSVFNVHINRSPYSGRVRAIRSKGSKFLAAFNGDASELNVQTRMDIEGPDGKRVGVVQITGLIARRIVCYASEGGSLVRGEPYGLICYGSRMEIYLPAEAEVRVRPGQRARAGRTILAEMPS